MAQVCIQISPALNPFWSSKWHGFLLCCRLSPLVWLWSQASGGGPLRTQPRVRVRAQEHGRSDLWALWRPSRRAELRAWVRVRDPGGS